MLNTSQFSRAVLRACLNSKSLSRSLATDATSTAVKQNKSQFSRRTPTSSLYEILNQNELNFNDLLSKFSQGVVELPEKTSVLSMTSVGHKFMNQSVKLSEDKSDVGTIEYQILKVLINNNLAHVSHFNRVCANYLRQNNAQEALSLYVESVEYLKHHPEALEVRDDNSELDRRLAFLFIAYNQACVAMNKQPESSYFKELLQVSKVPNIPQLKKYLYEIKAYKKLSSQCYKSLEKFKYDSMNYNNPESFSLATSLILEGKMKDADQIIEQIKSSSPKPYDETTYAQLMHLYSLSNNTKASLALWEDMVSQDVQPTIKSFNELLYTHTKLRDSDDKCLEKLEGIWEYLNKFYQPNAISYEYYLVGLIAFNQHQKAIELLNQLQKEAIIPLTLKMKDNVLSKLLDKNRLADAEKLFKQFLESDETYSPQVFVFNKLLSTYIKHKKYDQALQMFEKMSQYNVQPDIATYTIIISLMLKQSVNGKVEFDQLTPIFKEMKQNGIHTNAVTISSMVHILMQDPSTLEVGRLLVDYMKKEKMNLNFVTYTSIISSEFKFGDPFIGERFFKESISKAGIIPSTPYYNIPIEGFSKQNNMEKAIAYYNDLKNSNTKMAKPNHFTFYHLIRCADRLQDSERLQYLINELDSANIHLGRSLAPILKNLERTYPNIKVPENLNNQILQADEKAQTKRTYV
ncbi:BA75_02183T0 [Komagataella pastoris]|uniref:Mitochondrial 15S rRNA processing factor CCM1 n=1 Tax=Komagataella pastoris TaxID=4922 RepID=A0A1B2JD24_PICPA|nr:BA75_02183T0 [Komagataella pastoris]